MIARQQFILLGISVLAGCLLWACRRVPAEPLRGGVARLAELEIDPAQLENYKTALKEEIETSIRVEPGVLTLYAVSVKGQPAKIRLFFERYANLAAYRAHLETSHFQKIQN